jgi:drug/metabolite transporter (DMT)-like permease
MQNAVLLAIVASIFWGVGTVMQKQGMAAEFPKITFGNLIRQFGAVLKALVQNRIWFAGLIILIGGMLTYSYALANGDITLVQPIVNLTLVVAAVGGVVFLKEKVSGLEWLGIFVMLCGVVLIAFGVTAPTSVEPSTGAVLLMIAIFAGIIVASLLGDKIFPRLGLEFTMATAAGFSFALANVMGKVMTQQIIAEVGHFSLTDPACLASLATGFPIWVVISTNILGATCMQAAYANGRVSLVSPVATIIANTGPLIAAMAAFSEKIHMMRGIGILLALAGTAMLAMNQKPEKDE